MKILVLSALGRDSGCWLRARSLARSLRQAGAEVIIPVPDKSRPLMLDLLCSMVYYPLIALWHRPDVVIGIKPYPNVGLAGLVARLFYGSYFILDIDDLDHGYRKSALSTLSRILQAPFPPRADLVTCHNDRLTNYLQAKFELQHIYRLPQGVDPVFLAPQSSANPPPIIAEIGAGKRLFVYTAHLNIAAGLNEILTAWQLISLAQEGAHLLIVGGGPMAAHFEALAASLPRVTFTGYVAQAQVPSYIRAAYACLVYYPDKPVNYYRCSMKLREYLAMGQAVVTNGVGDLSAYPEFSLISPDPSPESFAKTIIENYFNLQSNPQARAFMANNLAWKELGANFYHKLEQTLATKP